MGNLMASTLRGLLDNSPQVYWVLDPKSAAIVYVSRAYETISGQDRRSLYRCPLSFLDAVHPEDREKARRAFEKHLRYEPGLTELRFLHQDGKVRWVQDRSFLFERRSGQPAFVAGISEDITSLHEQRHRSSSGLRREFELLANGIAHDFNNVLTAVVG